MSTEKKKGSKLQTRSIRTTPCFEDLMLCFEDLILAHRPSFPKRKIENCAFYQLKRELPAIVNYFFNFQKVPFYQLVPFYVGLQKSEKKKRRKEKGAA